MYRRHRSSDGVGTVAAPLDARSSHDPDVASPASPFRVPDTRSREAVPASDARGSTNAGLDPRVATHLLVDTNGGAG